MSNKSYLIGEVLSNLYRYGKSSLQIVNKYITDKEWFIHFKVNQDGNIDIYRESIIYKDESKKEIEDKYFWNVDSSELSYYVSYLLSASLTGGLREISDNSLEESKDLNKIVEDLYKIAKSKLKVSNEEIKRTFVEDDLILLDIFNSKEDNTIDLPNYDFPEDLINNLNVLLENLENRIDYIRELYTKLTSGNLGMLNINAENWLNLRSDESIPPIDTEKGKTK